VQSVEQEVAAVAAVDEATAEAALDLINVEYEVLPFVVDPDEAMAPGANNAGTFEEGNINPSVSGNSRGDVEAGFADADVIVEETAGWLSPHTHNQIEPFSTLAWWDNENQDCHLYVTTQNPFSHRNSAANALGLKLAHVHVYGHGCGGGFGTKNGSSTNVPAALLAKKTGKPVALRLPRRQYTVHNTQQYGPKLEMKLGFKNDGTLTAVEGKWWGDGGRNGGRSGWSDPDASTWKTPNYSVEQRGIATNKTRSGAWRCVAHPEGQFLSDIILEKAAAQLGFNTAGKTPLDFRKGIFVTEDMPMQSNGRPMDSFGVRKCLDKVAAGSGYQAKYHAPGTRTLPDGRMHGIGIHAHSDGHGGIFGGRGGIINMCEDGSVLFSSGSSRVMGGPNAQATIVAETIGVSFDNVRCGEWGSTDVAADAGCQCGSTLTISVGQAFQEAAMDVRQQLFIAAAEELGVTPQDLDARDNNVFVKTDPTQTMTHRDVMRQIGQPVIGRGVGTGFRLRKESPSVGDFPIGSAAQHKTGVATACEVAVDAETGDVEVLNYYTAVDAGRVIDRFSTEGQCLAGVPVMISQALLYDEAHDPGTGRRLSWSHLDDKMASSMDIPSPVDSHGYLLETIGAVGSFGCHGIGEPAICSWAAVNNAVNNALGVWVDKAPASPRNILEALGKA
jgi:xanthine dehydrogenase molybdenum-binding subunit